MKVWGKSLRFELINPEIPGNPEIWANRFVAAIWHDEMFPLIAYHAYENVTAIVSQSKDGEILAQVLHRFGYQTARGSSSRGGIRALVTAIKQMDASGAGTVVTVDGPRGPRHQVKPGAIFLAHKAKAPVIPVRAFMSSKFVFKKAWDRFQLPLPFSKCTLVYGDPIRIEDCETEEQMDAHCAHIERVLNEMEMP